MVYTTTGELIGDSADFYEWAKTNFGKVFHVTKESLKKRAKANISDIDKQIFKRDHGRTLIEKIEHSIKKSKKRGLVNNIEGYFTTKLDNGIEFYTRETNMNQHEVVLHEKDPIDIQKEEEKAKLDEEARIAAENPDEMPFDASKGMKFEEF